MCLYLYVYAKVLYPQKSWTSNNNQIKTRKAQLLLSFPRKENIRTMPTKEDKESLGNDDLNCFLYLFTKDKGGR